MLYLMLSLYHIQQHKKRGISLFLLILFDKNAENIFIRHSQKRMTLRAKSGEICHTISVSWRHLPQITNRFVKKSYYRKRLSKQRVKKPVFKSNDVWAAAGNRLKCAEGRTFRYSAASVPYPACSPGRSGTLAALRYRAEALNCRKSDIFSKTY